jgi:hypothetical protein
VSAFQSCDEARPFLVCVRQQVEAPPLSASEPLSISLVFPARDSSGSSVRQYLERLFVVMGRRSFQSHLGSFKEINSKVANEWAFKSTHELTCSAKVKFGFESAVTVKALLNYSSN